MSRTFRRKGDKKRNKSGCSHFEDSYTYDYVRHPGSTNIWIRVPLEGKAFSKAYWKFHRDHNGAYGWGNPRDCRYIWEAKCRMKNKRELHRYWKDNDYEGFAYNPGCLSWER